jgi:hypothetical protein
MIGGGNRRFDFVGDLAGAAAAVGHDHDAIAFAWASRLHWKPQFLPLWLKYHPSQLFESRVTPIATL